MINLYLYKDLLGQHLQFQFSLLVQRQAGQDSGYEDHMNSGYETDPGEIARNVKANDGSLYNTSDIAVVLDRPDKQGNRQVKKKYRAL